MRRWNSSMGLKCFQGTFEVENFSGKAISQLSGSSNYFWPKSSWDMSFKYKCSGYIKEYAVFSLSNPVLLWSVLGKWSDDLIHEMRWSFSCPSLCIPAPHCPTWEFEVGLGMELWACYKISPKHQRPQIYVSWSIPNSCEYNHPQTKQSTKALVY